MVTREQIESTDGFSKPVGTAAFVTEMLENEIGRWLLSGDEDVVVVDFYSGYRELGYTK